jgi:nicotinamidase-related amidase
MSLSYTAPLYSESALITIDMQLDFLDGQPYGIPGTSTVAPVIGRLAEFYRTKQRPIIHVVRLYCEDGSNVDIARRQLIESGTELVRPGSMGSQLARHLLPDEGVVLDSELLLRGEFQQIGDHEWVMYKSRWGAFYKTDLELHLRRLGVSTLVFAGCNFPNCPRTSVYQASERDFRVVLVEDAISGIYDKGRQELAGIDVHLVTTDQFLQEAA